MLLLIMQGSPTTQLKTSCTHFIKSSTPGMTLRDFDWAPLSSISVLLPCLRCISGVFSSYHRLPLHLSENHRDLLGEESYCPVLTCGRHLQSNPRRSFTKPGILLFASGWFMFCLPLQFSSPHCLPSHLSWWSRFYLLLRRMGLPKQ